MEKFKHIHTYSDLIWKKDDVFCLAKIITMDTARTEENGMFCTCIVFEIFLQDLLICMTKSTELHIYLLRSTDNSDLSNFIYLLLKVEEEWCSAAPPAAVEALG